VRYAAALDVSRFTPNPAKPESRTSPGNPNLETRNPKQQKTESAKKGSPDVGGLDYFRVQIFILFRNSNFGF